MCRTNIETPYYLYIDSTRRPKPRYIYKCKSGDPTYIHIYILYICTLFSAGTELNSQIARAVFINESTKIE